LTKSTLLESRIVPRDGDENFISHIIGNPEHARM
jgi:hypothetical protein